MSTELRMFREATTTLSTKYATSAERPKREVRPWRNIVRDRRYRLGLSDMSVLEIMPKGRYW